MDSFSHQLGVAELIVVKIFPFFPSSKNSDNTFF